MIAVIIAGGANAKKLTVDRGLAIRLDAIMGEAEVSVDGLKGDAEGIDAGLRNRTAVGRVGEIC